MTKETGYQLADRLGVHCMTGWCEDQKADLTLTPTSAKGTDSWRITTHAYYSCSVCGNLVPRSASTIRRHAATAGGTK